MRHLLLARHAHAEAPDGAEDFDRKLSERGRAEASAMAAWAVANAKPDRVVASAAVRTLETARAHGPDVEASERLYVAELEDYLDVIEETDESISAVLIVGHQPTVGGVAEEFDGLTVDKFPPGTIAVIEVPGEWADAFAEGQVVKIVTPADV